jgi:hypothetical protein
MKRELDKKNHLIVYISYMNTAFFAYFFGHKNQTYQALNMALRTEIFSQDLIILLNPLIFEIGIIL